MNPADAFRKTQRAKEIARNKKERKFQRDAHSMKDNPEAIKEELKSVLDMEETQEGRVNQTIRLKKRALQGAYDTALKKRKVSLWSCSMQLAEPDYQLPNLLKLSRMRLCQAMTIELFNSCHEAINHLCLLTAVMCR